MRKERYWVAVVSKDHAMRGVAGGFMQACHGKQAPLKRMHQDDWVLFYSPKQSMDGTEKCQSFTAVGRAIDDQVFSYAMSDTFVPFRRNIKFYNSEQISILPLIDQLEFITNKSKWGFQFRTGFFEINACDFNLISTKMLHHESE